MFFLSVPSLVDALACLISWPEGRYPQRMSFSGRQTAMGSKQSLVELVESLLQHHCSCRRSCPCDCCRVVMLTLTAAALEGCETSSWPWLH